MFKQQPTNSRTKKQRRLKERKEFSVKEQTKIQRLKHQPTNNRTLNKEYFNFFKKEKEKIICQATTNQHSDPKQRILKRRKGYSDKGKFYELIYVLIIKRQSIDLHEKEEILWMDSLFMLTLKLKYKKREQWTMNITSKTRGWWVRAFSVCSI